MWFLRSANDEDAPDAHDPLDRVVATEDSRAPSLDCLHGKFAPDASGLDDDFALNFSLPSDKDEAEGLLGTTRPPFNTIGNNSSSI